MNNVISNFYRGDTKRYRLILTDSSNNPIDLTGCVIWFTMKRNVNDDDSQAVIQKQITKHLDPENGITQLVLTANETSNINPGNYYYDFQLVDGDGNVTTLAFGKVSVLTDITRSY